MYTFPGSAREHSRETIHWVSYIEAKKVNSIQHDNKPALKLQAEAFVKKDYCEEVLLNCIHTDLKTFLGETSFYLYGPKLKLLCNVCDMDM